MIRQKYLQGLECHIYNEKIIWKQNRHLDLDTVKGFVGIPKIDFSKHSKGLM